MQEQALYSVACASESICFAVGYYVNNYSVHQTLIEKWDGSNWWIDSSPTTTITDQNEVWDVACPTQDQCWAVGHSNSSGHSQTLIQRWDGVSWTVFPSPNAVANTDSSLSRVACTSTSNCWAVGFSWRSNPQANYQTLIERWDGASWTIVVSPNPVSSGFVTLASIACASGNDCWAVGYYNDNSTYRTLTEHWDGTAWTIATSPNTNSVENNFLGSVACVSADDCWAIGNRQYGIGGTAQTLIERWDGNSWSIFPSPNSDSTQENLLYSVACVSSSKCWTVGQQNNSGVLQTLVEQWDGSAWSIVSSPNTSTAHFNQFFGITCNSVSDCWAVGAHATDNGVSQTLIEEYALLVPPLTSVGSRMTHGSAGTFDVDLSIVGKRGVECRSGGTNGNYSVVFTFVNDVTNCGSAGTAGGTIVPGPNANQCTENLTGVANAQYINVELDNVVDSQGNSGNIAVPMGVLIGDTTANGVVNSSDIVQTQSQSGQSLTSNNFREDVTVNGSINSSDIGLVQSKSGTGLPSPP